MWLSRFDKLFCRSLSTMYCTLIHIHISTFYIRDISHRQNWYNAQQHPMAPYRTNSTSCRASSLFLFPLASRGRDRERERKRRTFFHTPFHFSQNRSFVSFTARIWLLHVHIYFMCSSQHYASKWTLKLSAPDGKVSGVYTTLTWNHIKQWTKRRT